jgi:hypothetical protein
MKNTAAKIENGVVQQVIVGTIQWAQENLSGEWVDATGHSVGIGFTFDGFSFTAAQPYPSWVYDKTLNAWQPPVALPNDETKDYEWDEQLLSWVEISVTGKE